MARFTEQLRQILHRFNRTDGLDVTLTQIAEEIGRNRATVHSHLSRLCELGYLTRVDYGRYLITPEGREVLTLRPKSARAFVKCPDCGRKITL